MLHAFVFSKVSVIVRHWFEIGLSDGVMEHGARIEVRLLDAPAHRGTESAAQLLVINRPLWRVDLFDRLDRAAGTFSAAHFHPTFDGLEPSERVWDDELRDDPWHWAIQQLSDIDSIFAAKGVNIVDVDVDFDEVRAEAAQIVATAQAYAPTACTSVQSCHRWTKDASGTIRLMVKNMNDVKMLDHAHVSPWLGAGFNFVN